MNKQDNKNIKNRSGRGGCTLRVIYFFFKVKGKKVTKLSKFKQVEAEIESKRTFSFRSKKVAVFYWYLPRYMVRY